MCLTKFKMYAAVVLFLVLLAGPGLWAYWVPQSQTGQHAPGAALAAASSALPDAEPQAQEDKDKLAKLRFKSQENLKNIGLAMHDYHSVMGTFPPAAVLDKNKKLLLSWRVLLLPHMGEEELFRQFKLDEPWDSAHNKKLLTKMPKVYAPVIEKSAEPGYTFYQVFVGKGAAFEGERGLRISDFLDGTSNTALVIEGGEAVPWTKPADLNYDPKKPLPKLGGQFKDRIYVTFADGSVNVLRPDFGEQAMRELITRAGGEVLNLDALLLK